MKAYGILDENNRFHRKRRGKCQWDQKSFCDYAFFFSGYVCLFSGAGRMSGCLQAMGRYWSEPAVSYRLCGGIWLYVSESYQNCHVVYFSFHDKLGIAFCGAVWLGLRCAAFSVCPADSVYCGQSWEYAP